MIHRGPIAVTESMRHPVAGDEAAAGLGPGRTDPFLRTSAVAALLLAGASIAYAVLYLLVGRQQGDPGRTAAWLTLAAGAVLGSAAYVGLYTSVRTASEGFSLWGLVLGEAHQVLTLVSSVFQATIGSRSTASQTDPKGLATFLLFGFASAVFGCLLLRSPGARPALGLVGLANAVLLAFLFASSASGNKPLILVAGGLSSLVLTPLWWCWIGLRLWRRSAPATGDR